MELIPSAMATSCIGPEVNRLALALPSSSTRNFQIMFCRISSTLTELYLYEWYSARDLTVELSRSCAAMPPTLQRSTINPQEADNFYELLNNVVLKTKNRDELWILGDLNAKVGSSRPGSVSPVGCYSKHTISNSNGCRLVEFCEDNRLVLTNTLFKHRMQHRSTWFSDGLVHADGKPVRNMIDYVIVKRSTMAAVLDARSFGGFTTRSDHHPVIAVLGIALSKVHPTVKQQDPCFNRYNRPTAESSKTVLRPSQGEVTFSASTLRKHRQCHRG